MEISELALRLFVLLVPGVLCALVVDELTVHKPWAEFRFTLYSMLFGLVTYALLQTGVNLGNWFFNFLFDWKPFRLVFWKALFDSSATIRLLEVVVATFAAIPLAAFITMAINRKWTTKLARRWKLSEKFGDESLYDFFLNSSDVSWVNVRCFDKNVMLYGWRESFSDQDGVREILLRDVRVFSLDQGVLLYESDAIYLTLSIEDTIIETVK